MHNSGFAFLRFQKKYLKKNDAERGENHKMRQRARYILESHLSISTKKIAIRRPIFKLYYINKHNCYLLLPLQYKSRCNKRRGDPFGLIFLSFLCLSINLGIGLGLTNLKSP